MNTIEETSSTKGSLSPSPASFMESLTEHYTEAQNESRAPDLQDLLNNELEQELVKESQLIKKDKLQEIYLYNIDYERQRSEGTTGTISKIEGDENS